MRQIAKGLRTSGPSLFGASQDRHNQEGCSGLGPSKCLGREVPRTFRVKNAGLLANFHAGEVPRTFRVKNAGLLANFHAGEAPRTFRAENAGFLAGVLGL